MTYRLPVNDPVHATIRFADLVGGDYGLSVRLKARIAGQDEYVYLPGTAPDVLTTLHAAGVIATVPEALPAPDDRKGISLALGVRDVVLTLDKPDPKAHGRLVVAANGHPKAAASPAASTPASGAHSAPAGHPEPSAPTLDAGRAALVASFRAAVEATVREIGPAFTNAGIVLDGDVTYRC